MVAARSSACSPLSLAVTPYPCCSYIYIGTCPGPPGLGRICDAGLQALMDEQYPRDANGQVIYGHGVELLDTWGALEQLVEARKCRAIGLSDASLGDRIVILPRA